MPKKKQPYFDKLKTIYGDNIDEAYLLHYGSYFRKRTVESSAKSYFESAVALEPKVRKRAEQLGLI